MRYLALVFLVAVPLVSGQAAVWGQCKWNESLLDEADSLRRWRGMDRVNCMCIWVLLHLF